MSLASRRTILQTIGKTLACGPFIITSKAVCGAMETPGMRGKSRVIVARKEGVLLSNNQLDIKSMNQMLDRTAGVLGDSKDSLDIWRKLFKSSDIVGLKVNTLGGRMLSPHPELVYAIAERLAQVGVDPKRIIIWDRSERELQHSGFDANSAAERALVLATDSKGIGYEQEPEMSGSIGSCFSRIISKICTAMINVGVLKDHDLSGISVGMKNLFGLIHNPNRYHFDVHKDPYLPDLCLHPYVKDKLRLTICDGFRGQYNGGPAYKPGAVWNHDGILMSQDQVALDSVAADIIERERLKHNLLSFKAIDREPLYLQLAEEKRLGITDRSRIDIKEISI